MKDIKRGISVLFVLMLFAVLLNGCSNNMVNVSEITADMEYYNQKAVDNIQSLIGRNQNEVEQWI